MDMIAELLFYRVVETHKVGAQTDNIAIIHSYLGQCRFHV